MSIAINPPEWRDVFHAPDQARQWNDILSWWESRRLAYNAFVGLSILLSLVFFNFVHFLPKADPTRNIAAQAMLALFAMLGCNFFYTAGWVVEILIKQFFPGHAMKLGPALLAVGFAFSFFVVFAPVAFHLIAWSGRYFS